MIKEFLRDFGCFSLFVSLLCTMIGIGAWLIVNLFGGDIQGVWEMLTALFQLGLVVAVLYAVVCFFERR